MMTHVCTVGTKHFQPSFLLLKPISTHSDVTISFDYSHMYAGIENLDDITSYLYPLDKTAVFNLGIALGINYYRLKAIIDTPTFLHDMLAWWMQGLDQVLQTGVPTWWRLVEALKDPRVGQTGIASKIEQKQASQLM